MGAMFGPMPRDALNAEQLQALTALGLSRAAANVYQHILLRDDWSEEEIAEDQDQSLDGTAVARAIDELKAVALLVPSQENSDVFRPIDPRVGLTRLLREKDGQIRSSQNSLARARDAAEQLITLRVDLEERRVAGLEQVLGRDRIADKLAELLQNASSEVLTLLTMLPNSVALQQARLTDVALLERGISTRLIVLAGHLRQSREFADHLRMMVGLGAQVRVAVTLSTRMIVVDRKVAIVPSDPTDPGAGATLINQRGIIHLLTDAFESAWREAASLDQNGTSRSEQWQPNDLEREVIRLLGEGNKDEAIARRVGMSLRSVRRLISQISTELGSESRFELGVLCHSRGWV